MSRAARITLSSGTMIELLGVHSAALSLTSQGYTVNQAQLVTQPVLYRSPRFRRSTA
jgi:hypothetical protein